MDDQYQLRRLEPSLHFSWENLDHGYAIALPTFKNVPVPLTCTLSFMPWPAFQAPVLGRWRPRYATIVRYSFCRREPHACMLYDSIEIANSATAIPSAPSGYVKVGERPAESASAMKSTSDALLSCRGSRSQHSIPLPTMILPSIAKFGEECWH